jgi:hypothetical protein
MSAGKTLFRAEAVEHHAGAADDHGDVLRFDKRWARVTYAILVLAAVVGFLLISLCSVSEYASGPAVVRIDGRRTLTAPVQSTIDAVEVQPGQLVDTGAVLVRMHVSDEMNELQRASRELDLLVVRMLRDPNDATIKQSITTLRAARYETDLPRELDPCVPPPHVMVVPDGGAQSVDRIRTAWLNQLGQTFWIREGARGRPDLALDWTKRYFPSELLAELEARFGSRVAFDRFVVYAPVAKVPRMVFCPRELDFERSRSARHVTWVGPCIDERRIEPPFNWDVIPPDASLAYCAFGTQSLREPQAPAYLQTIADAFASRRDFFLVIACPAQHRPATRPIAKAGARVLVVESAPQLALLRRAKLAIHHAGFNSIKECARYGVPMVTIPLSHDQPRNAALVEHRRLGVAFDRDVELTVSMVNDAVDRVTRSPAIRESCERMKGVFEGSAGCAAALSFIDDRLAAGASEARRKPERSVPPLHRRDGARAAKTSAMEAEE